MVNFVAQNKALLYSPCGEKPLVSLLVSFGSQKPLVSLTLYESVCFANLFT
jgi:hypothetical protein